MDGFTNQVEKSGFRVKLWRGERMCQGGKYLYRGTKNTCLPTTS